MAHERLVHPPEHVKPLEAHSEPAKTLKDLSTLFKHTHDEFMNNPRLGLSGEVITSIARGAEKSRLDLTRYWLQARGVAYESFPASADKAERKTLKEIDGSLKKLDSELGTHLQRWEEATSPFDHYDPDAIAAAGRDLLASIGRLNAIVDPAGADMAKTNLATYAEMLKAAVAGLSGEVSKRLDELAAGRTVEMVTLSNKVKALADRASPDVAREKIQKQLDAAQKDRDGRRETIKEKFPDEKVQKNRDRLAELDTLFEAINKERRELNTELQKVLDKLTITPKDEALKQRRDSLQAEIQALNNKFPTEAKEQGKLRKWLREFESASSAMKAAQADLNAAQIQIKSHDQLLRQSQSEVASAEDLGKYWKDVKESVLTDAGDISTELRDALDKCFASGLHAQLDKFGDPNRSADDTSKDAAKLVETLENYWTQAEIVLARSGADVGDILEKLGCSLTALRQKTARQLELLVKLFD